MFGVYKVHQDTTSNTACHGKQAYIELASMNEQSSPPASDHYPRAQASRVMKSGWCPYIVVIKKIVIERTRDLIYLKFVATDFFQKIISPSAGENSGDLA